MAKFLIVVVNTGDREDARIFLSGVILPRVFFVPVENAANEGRDQRDLGFSASNGLMHPKKERQIAVNAFLFERFSSTDPFPGRGDLDQDALPWDALAFILRNDFSPLQNRCLGVERESRINFCRDPSFDDLEDPKPKGNGQAVKG